MELFVVNRHEEEATDSVDVPNEDDEKLKLDKVLKKIEKNKKLRSKQKDRQQKVKTAKQKTIALRQIKREVKSKIVPVPDNFNEILDNTVIEESIEDSNLLKDETDRQSGKNKRFKHSELNPEALKDFTILGADNFTKKSKVKRVLPHWLANPTVISVNLQNLETKVSELKQLDKGIRKLLKANNIKYLFPVQATVIPYLLKTAKQAQVMFPSDICVSAPTGSGKTLAFVLPVIQVLKRHMVKKIRALVILPTQDLATQVFKAFKTYSQNTNIDICLITGNNPFLVEQSQLIVDNQAFGPISKVDILVCTAGRLVDHLKMTKGLDLQNLEYIIIDEADRVLDNVQNDWLYHLEKHINEEGPTSPSGKVLNLLSLQKRRPPQKLLFSATLSQDPEKLQKLSLFQPKLFTSVVEDSPSDSLKIEQNNMSNFIGKFTTPKELTEKYIVTSLDLKPLYLYKFIKVEKITKSIVFTHSVESAHRLAILLRALFKDERKIEEVSSNLQGKNRTKLIEKFSSGNVDVFVCTDALARGIDLPNVQCVVSYSAPKYLKTYIHRAGRTARAGELGLAVTLLTKSQLPKFKSLLHQADKTNVEELVIPEDDLEPLGEQYQQSLQELKKIIEKEEKLDLEKTLSVKRTKRVKRKRKHSASGSIASK